MATTDELGIWEEIGTVTPLFYQWTKINFPIEERNNLIRLTYLAPFQNVDRLRTSVGYFRSLWETTPPIYSDWTKFFPKIERETIEVYAPSELSSLATTIPRYLEVTKYPYRNSRQIDLDPNWSITLEILIDPVIPLIDFDNMSNLNRTTRLQDLITLQQNLVTYLFL